MKKEMKKKMKNRMNEVVQKDVDDGKIKLSIKDRCFVCGRKIGTETDPVVRYSKQGNTCSECFTCSGFSKSTVPEKAGRYKQWCLKLDLLQNK